MKVVPVGIWCVCVIKIISGGVNDTRDVQRIQNEKTGKLKLVIIHPPDPGLKYFKNCALEVVV